MVICYRILSGERPARRRTLTGVFLGFGAVAVLITATGAGGAFPPWTIAAVVLAGLSWAFGSWYQPRLRLPGDPFVVAVYEMLVGGGVLTILGLANGEGFHRWTIRHARGWRGPTWPGSARSSRSPPTCGCSSRQPSRWPPPTHTSIRWWPYSLGQLILAEPVTMPTIARRSGRGGRRDHRRELRTPSRLDGGKTGHDDPLISYYNGVPRPLAEEALRRGRGESSVVYDTPWPLDGWPDVPTRLIVCQDDQFFPAAFLRQVAQQRLGMVPDEVPGCHCVALSHPRELSELLVSYLDR